MCDCFCNAVFVFRVANPCQVKQYDDEEKMYRMHSINFLDFCPVK